MINSVQLALSSSCKICIETKIIIIFYILGLDELGPEEKSLNNGTHNIDVFKGKFCWDISGKATPIFALSVQHY